MKGTAIPLFTLVVIAISILSCCLVLFFVTVTIVNRATTGTQRRSIEQRSIKRQMHFSVLANLNYQSSKCIIQLSPLLAICFMTPLIAASAEKYVPLSIFIAGAGTFLTGRTVSKFSSQTTHGGSLVALVYQSLGPALGIYCGILHIFALIFLTMGSAAFLSQFTSDIFTSINANSNESKWYVSPLFFVLLLQMSAGIVSIRGLLMRTQLLVTFSSAGMCLVLGIVVVSNVHAVGLVSINSNRTVLTLSTTASPTLSPPPQFGHFCKSVLYSSLIFNGYESATAMSDETNNSKITTGQSVAYTIIASMVFYVLSSGLLSFGYATGHDWELDTSTVVTLSRHFMNRGMSHLYFIGVLIDGWVGSVALLNVISSLLHGLSYQGLPCQKLNLLHAISTPYVAVMCTVFLTLFLTTCAFYAVGFKMKSVVVFAADCGGVLAQAVYFLVMVGGHVEFQTFEPIVAATVALVAVFGATFGSGTVASGYLTAFSIIVLSGIGVCVVKRRSPQTFDGDTACQEDTEENVPLLLLQQEEKEKEEEEEDQAWNSGLKLA
jgi:amino acid transporter